MSSHPQIRGVILDIDGTFVDSNDLHAQAFVDVFARHGTPAPFDEVRRLIGMGAEKIIPRFTGWAEDDPRARALAEERTALFREKYLAEVLAFPRGDELVARMRADGIAVVVGSSASREELRPLLEIAGIASLIEEETSSDDADRSKPDPDIVRAALAKLKLPADQVIMLGDTPYDLDAANRAGVELIALRSGGWDDEALVGAIAIYDNPADLLVSYEGSPLGSSTNELPPRTPREPGIGRVAHRS
jgi:HAD superfamily hydrolase (TIGR01509 family)